MKRDDEVPVCNGSANRTFAEVLERHLSRRQLLQGGVGTAALGFLGGGLTLFRARAAAAEPALLGFQGVPVSTDDDVHISSEYVAEVVIAWGDPVSDGPPFLLDASNTAADQELQYGMHADGMHFFPLPFGSNNPNRGLLVVNHEYTDEGLLHAEGFLPRTPEKVAKSQAAHGVSVVELERAGGSWRIVRDSAFARRITAATPIEITGPAAGHPLVQTATDPDGRLVLGTINNCAHGFTPWGTYLTCEENFNGYFITQKTADRPPLHRRYGVSNSPFNGFWWEVDERFDADLHPNEPNRFGWVVEIDPFDPASTPKKRTALGRMKHEGALTVSARDKRVVVYMGDDERFEYIYKFVSRDRVVPASARSAPADLLDEGTLYVARFEEDGTGEWLALTPESPGLAGNPDFLDLATILVNARGAADAVGATKMDRPEWIAAHPRSGEVYATLTNNSRRGGAGQPAADAANPRANNVYGHIIRWREAGGDAAATTFEWDIFVLAGDPDLNPDPADAKHGNVNGDKFGSPDGLWFDERGLLWIQTDVSTSVLNAAGDYFLMGNNQMLGADPVSAEIRRFLTGPVNCEVTGVVTTPDRRTMFVNIQHPGERSDDSFPEPDQVRDVSNWPDHDPNGRPRSATLLIRRTNGGIIGT